MGKKKKEYRKKHKDDDYLEISKDIIGATVAINLSRYLRPH